MIYFDVAKKIESLRDKLHESIDKNGLEAKITRDISMQIDSLVNEYYKRDIQYPERECF